MFRRQMRSVPALSDYFYVLSGRVRDQVADGGLKSSLIDRYVRDSEQKILARLRCESRKIDDFLHDAMNRPPEFVRHDEISVLTDELDPRLVNDWDARRQISSQLYGFLTDRLGFDRARVEPSYSFDYFRVSIPMHADLCRSQAQAVKDKFAQKSGLPNEIDPLVS